MKIITTLFAAATLTTLDVGSALAVAPRPDISLCESVPGPGTIEELRLVFEMIEANNRSKQPEEQIKIETYAVEGYSFLQMIYHDGKSHVMFEDATATACDVAADTYKRFKAPIPAP